MTETPVVPALHSLVGSTLGSYRLVRLLGSGGMGHVYEGLHPQIGARVAIKVLLPEVASNPTVVERFFNEARAVNLIGHRNVVKILDMALEGGRYYFVMELLEGVPLSARVSPGKPLPFAEAGPIVIQCADALQAAHDREIIHRDDKPDNIFLVNELGRSDFVKIVDFGIAKLAGANGVNASVLRTAAGVVMGTPAFMSPEQAEGAAEKIDGRSDVYSLGVVMFQLATGQLPFNEPTHVKVMMAHLATKPPLPTALAPQTPRQVERIILRCLAKEREDRFQSMRELRAAVEAALRELSLGSEAPLLQPTLELEAVSLESEATLSPGNSLPPPAPGAAGGQGLGPAVPLLGSGMPDEPLPGAEMFEERPLAPKPQAALELSRGPPEDEPLELDLPAPSPEEVLAASLAAEEQPAAPKLRPGRAAVIGFLVVAFAAVGLALVLRGRAPAPVDDGAAAVRVPAAPPRGGSQAVPERPDPGVAEPTAANAPELKCPKRSRQIAGPTIELKLVSDPEGARVRATWAGGGCELGTTPWKLAVPQGARVQLRYLLDGHAPVDAEAVADVPRLVFESLLQ